MEYYCEKTRHSDRNTIPVPRSTNFNKPFVKFIFLKITDGTPSVTETVLHLPNNWICSIMVFTTSRIVWYDIRWSGARLTTSQYMSRRCRFLSSSGPLILNYRKIFLAVGGRVCNLIVNGSRTMGRCLMDTIRQKILV